MKIILIITALVLSGCAAKYTRHTIFLKEDSSTLVNLKGKTCLESGYGTYKINGNDYKLVVYYENCDVQKHRSLKEYELKQWGLEPAKD